jgi:hypothetical protein
MANAIRALAMDAVERAGEVVPTTETAGHYQGLLDPHIGPARAAAE